jgi:integrative and conjugative element protein (TIGR02256 family)
MRIEQAPDIEARLRHALHEAGKREIGGMLMAEQLAPGRFRLVDFSLDPITGSHSEFRRDPDKHRQTLDDFFRRTGHDFRRFNYLGEWHSHPSFSVHPSQADITTMTEIVEDAASEITFAVLLIVRTRWRFWIDHSLTVFARGQAPTATRFRPRIVRI